MENKNKENQELAENTSSYFGVAATGPAAPRAQLLESLSAMMDNEADSLETRRLVKTLERSSESSAELAPELLNRWRRYHAVRASLQHEIHSAPAIDLLTGVRARLEAEGAPGAIQTAMFRKPLRTGKVFRIAGQGLIAATVAAAVLVAYPLLNRSQNGSATSALVASQQLPLQKPVQDSLPAMNGEYSASALTRTVSLDDAARRRLETAVRNFSGTTAVLNGNNSAMLVNQLQPFATSVSTTPNIPANPDSIQSVQRR